MKKLLVLLILVVTAAGAQQKKYQSLLWEVSGNGLAKNSYLYGSMHVSEKVSYHLSDSFFKHLLASDYVANESEPSSWIAIYDVLNGRGNYRYPNSNNSFYAEFYQEPIRKEALYPLFYSNNYTMNNLLFRTNENQKDYQEDTYLDMFIHQTGKKYKKQTVGLEDAKASMISIMNAENGEMKPKEENMQAIMKILKEKSFNQALLDYYRDKNLDMVDSLYTLIGSENYLKAMLYDRNVVMTRNFDSIAKKGSLFAAIGAAHLPGKNGVIELLRKKGYTVTPVIDAYTEKGKGIKKEIDDYFIKPVFEVKTTADGMVKLPMNNQLIYNGDDISTPDLANGGIINLKRILTKNYLRKDNTEFHPQTIDSLFYENIPGEIIEKKFFKDDNFTGYDIRNKTKTGNAQHYKYYITPLEIITVSMSGNGNYVRQYENEIFNSIKLRKSTSAWETIVPQKGGFTVSAPGYYTLYGNRNSSNPENLELNAYDEKEKAYYFISERTLEDNINLEETGFELKRIQDEFFTQLSATSRTEIRKTGTTYESSAKVGDKTITLKSMEKGSKYYLLGTVRASEENTRKFFDSFAFVPFHYTEPTKTYTDSIGQFSIAIPERQNEKLFWKTNAKKNPREKDKKENIFIGKSENYIFTSESGKTVDLRFMQYHRYRNETGMDSVWADFRKSMKQEYDDYYDSDYDDDRGRKAISNLKLDDYNLYTKKGYSKSSWDALLGLRSDTANDIQLVNEKITHNKENDTYQMLVTATSAKSNQAIKYKIVFKDGYTYWFKAMTEKDYKNDDPFIEKTFDSFVPLPTKKEFSVFDNKVKLFIKDATSGQDSIRYSAMKSIYMLDIRKDDLNDLKQFVTTFKFNPDEVQPLTSLFQKIGHIEDPQVIPFLENFYKKDNSNTMIQFAVLRALANQKSKAGYKKILELLEYDLPLSNNNYEIYGLFNLFQEDTENSQALFPDIFQFYSIKEYHDPIVGFTTELFEKGLVNPKKLSGYKKMILTNAKLEYKRMASWKAKNDAKEEDDYYNPGSGPVSDLIDYMNLIYPYKKDKAVAALFDKIATLDNDNLNIEMARLDLINDTEVNPALQQKILAKSETKFVAYHLLSNKKAAPAIENWTDEAIAEAAIVHFRDINAKKDSLRFAEKKVVPYGDKTITYYFYKISPRDPEKSYNRYGGGKIRIATVAFVNQKDRINPHAFKSMPIRSVVDEEELAQVYEALIDESLNEAHIRASFGKQENRNNGGMMTEYIEEDGY